MTLFARRDSRMLDLNGLWNKVSAPSRAKRTALYFCDETIEMATEIALRLADDTDTDKRPSRIISDLLNEALRQMNEVLLSGSNSIDSLDHYASMLARTDKYLEDLPKSKLSCQMNETGERIVRSISNTLAAGYAVRLGYSEFIRALAHVAVKQVYDEYSTLH